MRSSRVAVAFPKPGYFVADMRLVVMLDGQPIHDGSFVDGFSALRAVAPGRHEITTSIRAGLFSRRRKYAIDVPEGAELTFTLAYSRFWGNFVERLGVSDGVSALESASSVAVPTAVKSALEIGAFEQVLRAMTPRIVVTPVIVAVNLLVFALMVARGVSAFEPTVQNLLDWGADYGPRVAAGEVWRLATNMFVHIGIIHLAFNMVVLGDAGRRIERMFGTLPFAALYLASGLVGSVVSLAAHPYTVSAGASGAIFGVFGGFGALLIRQRGSISQGVLSRLGTGAVTFVLYNVVYGAARQGIDLAAHLGGLAGGFALGLALARPMAVGARPRLAAAVATLALACLGAVGAVRVFPKYPDFIAEIDAFAAVESKVLGTFNDAIRRAQASELGDDQFADVLERDVLPPWREARARLAAMSGLPDEQLRRRDLVLEYMDAREQGWSMFDDALHHHDAEAARRATDKQKEAERVLDRLKALNERHH